MNKDDYKNPEEHIFYCDKTGWYDEDESGKKDWSKCWSSVEDFWTQAREAKMAKKDYDFREFVFPESVEQTFWKEGEEHIFSGAAVFDFAEFSGAANFRHTKFSGVASFYSIKFSGVANFRSTEFSGVGDFSRTEFSGIANFGSAKFSGVAGFSRAEFSGAANFHSAEFSGVTDFSRAEFSGAANFHYANFSVVANFNSANFSGAADFRSVQFLKPNSESKIQIEFRKCLFSKQHRTLFSNWTVETQIVFEDVIFANSVQFQRCNFEKVAFLSCDLIKVNFSNCTFNKNNGRLILNNEKEVLKTKNKETLTDLTSVYRQLKSNYMVARNWSEAGDAYRSEMVMKRELALLQKKHINSAIMWIYDKSSGYQQSMSRPLYCLLGLLVIVPAILYMICPCFGIHAALTTSFNSALPIVGKLEVGDYPSGTYYLLLFERLSSIVLITFFVLATRARLRQ